LHHSTPTHKLQVLAALCSFHKLAPSASLSSAEAVMAELSRVQPFVSSFFYRVFKHSTPVTV
jgi:hypothetical protein